MRTFGLIGNPLGHSFSKNYFEKKFAREGIHDVQYELFELKSIAHLLDLLKHKPGLCGLNVTIPYKEEVIPYLHHIDETARQIGAVNCIHIKGGRLIGYNTDAYGFEVSLNGMLATKPVQAFVLGNGGSAKAVCFVLAKMQIPFTVVSRKQSANTIMYSDIESQWTTGSLLVNTTPLGMFPNISGCPDVPYHLLTAADYLFDLIYNPTNTLFLQKGQVAGSATKNGLQMLELQAERSWHIWVDGN